MMDTSIKPGARVRLIGPCIVDRNKQTRTDDVSTSARNVVGLVLGLGGVATMHRCELARSARKDNYGMSEQDLIAAMNAAIERGWLAYDAACQKVSVTDQGEKVWERRGARWTAGVGEEGTVNRVRTSPSGAWLYVQIEEGEAMVPPEQVERVLEQAARAPLSLDMSLQAAVLVMSERHAGAIVALGTLLRGCTELQAWARLLAMDEMSIRGANIWAALKEYCRDNADTFLSALEKRDAHLEGWVRSRGSSLPCSGSVSHRRSPG